MSLYEDDQLDMPQREPNQWDIPDLVVDHRGDKGTVAFRSPEDLSGRDIARLRNVIGAAKNEGDATNRFFGEGLTMLVESWDIPGKPHLAIPRGDRSALSTLPATVLAQLEQHVEPHLKRLLRPVKPDADDDSPGSPYPPESA